MPTSTGRTCKRSCTFAMINRGRLELTTSPVVLTRLKMQSQDLPRFVNMHSFSWTRWHAYDFCLCRQEFSGGTLSGLQMDLSPKWWPYHIHWYKFFVYHSPPLTCHYISVYVSCMLCRIKPLDILLMKQLHEKVNVVPLIAKADMLTIKEVQKMKRRVCNRKFWKEIPDLCHFFYFFCLFLVFVSFFFFFFFF